MLQGRKWASPKNFNLGRIHWSRSEFGALGLVLIISPSFELRIMYHFFYGLLIHQGTFFQNFKFFLNQLDQFPKIFSLGRIHWSGFKFGVLRIVLIISPSSELGITQSFFYGLLIIQEKFLKNFNFFLNRINWFPKNFSLVRIHWSRSEFRALGVILVISPSSDLRIVHHFF